ncbi:MAG: tetratricopeptide repeat protein [Desulfobacterales bacterium]|nr:MAG: tetratricopeptide repeat protein [Desulfobacterales bacterium]
MQSRPAGATIDIVSELRKGLAFHQSGQSERAQEVYRRILDRDPLHPDALHLLGLLALEAGKAATAVALIGKAVHLDPGQAVFYNNLGNGYFEKGETAEAILKYQKAIELKPNYAEAWFNLGNAYQQQRRGNKAVHCYQQALAIESDLVAAWFNLGRAQKQQQRLSAAIQCFQEVMRRQPGCAEAYEERGAIYRDLSRWDEALDCYEKALAINPDSWRAYFNLGNVYREKNENARAIDYYRQALKREPLSAETYLNMGIAHKALGDTHEAAACYQRAAERAPDLAEAYYNLGNLYQETGVLEQAVRYYQRALALKPSMNAVLNNLGNVCQKQGDFQQACDCFRRSIEADRHNPDTWYNLGNAFSKMGRWEEAVSVYEKVLDINPDMALAYNGMGNAYQAVDRIDGAVRCYRQALAIEPENAIILYNLGLALQTQGEYAASKQCFRKAMQLDPGMSAAQWQYRLLLPVLYASEEELRVHRRRFMKGVSDLIRSTDLSSEANRRHALDGISSRTNFYLPYQGRNDIALQKKYGSLITRIMAANYPQWAQPRRMPFLRPGGKIRIGFVSSCMYSHTVGIFLQGWVENLNREDFKLYGYYIGNKTDALTEYFQNAFDAYQQIYSNLERTARRIVADDLHILVFTDIGMNPMTLQLAACRLAPVQCAEWGHPVTTGLSTVDYYLSSDLMEPEDASAHYAEELVRLPNLALCYRKPGMPPYPAGRQALGIDEAAFVYLSPQSLFKYLPQYDWIFPRIAQRVQNAKFVFISHQSAAVTQAFKRRLTTAFESYRLNFEFYGLFMPRLHWEDYLSLNLVSNVLLDTPGWSGGKTTLEGISCGLPVVTLPG